MNNIIFIEYVHIKNKIPNKYPILRKMYYCTDTHKL